MTQEDKELLLKYLCMALPYGVMIKEEYGDYINVNLYNVHLEHLIDRISDGLDKLVIRSMSSMTEEESNELESITFPLMEKDWDGNENPACIRWIDIPKYMDFILSHHFDYQGLIEKGLALEVTKENNPYKD